MIRYVLRFFGLPIFTVDTIHYEFEVEESEAAHIEGGSAHNFERDVNPISPDDRYDGWGEEWRFGFK